MKRLLTFVSLFLFTLSLWAQSVTPNVAAAPGTGPVVQDPPPSVPIQDIVVLVPGFFNSFAPEYFSQDIINVFRNKGFKVYIVGKLDPIGTIEANGATLIPQLETIQRDSPKSKLNIVAHSAGGFYALYALNHSKVKVDTMLTVSTPFEGVDFLQAWREDSLAFKELTDLACLSGLRQLTKTYVDTFLKTVRMPANMKVFAFGGFQPHGLNVLDSRNLSAVMRIPAHFIPGNSDGIVSFKSSIAGKTILDVNNKAIKMYVDKNFYIPLEHWEQVLDYKDFLLLGTLNIGAVRSRQITFYSGLADLITGKITPKN